MYNKNYKKKDLELIIELIQNKERINLGQYRSSFLKKCLEYRIQCSENKNLNGYYELLKTDNKEMSLLISDLNIHVSWFFRNEFMWSLLNKILLPHLIENKIKNDEKLIRIWSAGCSNGEEPYTVSILLRELLENIEEKLTVKIFATDVHQKSLAVAKKGNYTKEAVRNIPLGLLTKYFSKYRNGYTIKYSLKEIVNFSEFDMLNTKHNAPPNAVFSDFDIVLCRNVLIYYNKQAQIQMFSKLKYALTKNSYLILGEAEEPIDADEKEFMRIFNTENIYEKI